MKFSLITLVVYFVFFSSICSYASETVKVASIFAKTGVAAAGNSSAIAGVRHAVYMLNRDGGILGSKIELIEYDNHSTALHSKAAAEMAVKAKVACVIGANWSSHSIAMAKVLQRAEIPMISPHSTSPLVTLVGDYIFRVCFIDAFQGKIMANFAFRDLGAKTAALLVNASGRHGESLADFFTVQFTQSGGEIVFRGDYIHDTEDFSENLKKIYAIKPGIVFVPGNIVDSGRILKQARQMGIKSLFLGGDGWGNDIYDHAGDAVNGSYLIQHWNEKNESRKSMNFVQDYQNHSTGDLDSGTALAYDAVFLFADAADRAGTFDPKKIRKALASTTNFNGVTGKISFDKDRNPIKSAVISKFDKGKKVYVKTIHP